MVQQQQARIQRLTNFDSVYAQILQLPKGVLLVNGTAFDFTEGQITSTLALLVARGSARDLHSQAEVIARAHQAYGWGPEGARYQALPVSK